MMLHAPSKKRTTIEHADGGVDVVLATSIGNGEDLGPAVRHAFESGRPEALLHQLRIIVKKKEVEIEELCKLHYEDFIVAVDELRGVLVDADELKSMLSRENCRLQEVASALLLRLEELLELYLIKKNVTEAIQTLKICVQVSKLCLTCNLHISNRRFYPALKILDLVEKDYIQKTPLKALRKVFEKQIPAIKLYIEKKVCSEFNDWLVHIRGAAKEIGQLAIGQAASTRQREEEKRARRREAEEQSDSLYTLDIEHIEDDDSVLEFDLTPVYRAHHIHTCLGIEEKFREYYHKNRLMQLNLDLQISSAQAFLESHQPFFAQIAGFFIVEDRVLRTAGGLLSVSQMEAIWETAISKMTSVLENQFSRTDTASHLLLIKDFVTLLCATLTRHGYRVAPLLEVLDNSRNKYHELLLGECSKQIGDILASDTFEQMLIKKEYEYNMYVLSFHLQSSDTMPTFPYVAPFSSSVPDVCRLVRSFIEDSVSYLSYGGHINFFDVVKKYLDKLLTGVLNQALLNMVHSNLGVSQSMQISSNIAVLERTCDLFLLQAAQLCSVPLRFVERPNAGLTAKAVLKASQNASYNSMLNVVDTKLDEYLSVMNSINWTADDAPENENEYIHEVVAYLEFLISSAQQIMPVDVLYKIGVGATTHINDFIVAAFLSESLKRFNLNAVTGIGNDLKVLESFAEERYHSTGLSESKKDCSSFRDCLIEARQLVNLLLSNQPENFMNPVIREKNYGALDYKKVATICEKFKDAPDRLFGSLSSRNTKQDARKKSMDMLKKRLKDFS